MSIKPFFLAAAVVASAPALATTASIRFLSRDAGDPTLSNSALANYVTGALNYTDGDSGSFLAYCIEPDQSFALSFKSNGTTPNFKNYTVDSFTGSQATLLQALYSSSFGAVHSGKQQAAFQLAVWEIVTESSTALSIVEGNGSFFLKTAGLTGPAHGTATAVEALATNYLNAAQLYDGAAKYSLTKLTNGTYQDLVVATALAPVPEPESYALFLAGLGAIGLIARRRLPR